LEIYEIIADYEQWFYGLTVVWTFLEGESFVILAGAAAYHGALNLPLLIASAWFGSFAGDQFYFFIGRRYGHRLLRRFPKMQVGVDTALELLHKYHVGFILSFRFIYGLRNVSSFACGMSELAWTRFLALNFIAAGVWATAFAGAGYLLGSAFEAMLGDIARNFGLVMLAIFIFVAWLAVELHQRRKLRASHAHPAPPPAAEAVARPAAETTTRKGPGAH
jgi:membrane protein DedA with SNARE-associated domain